MSDTNDLVRKLRDPSVFLVSRKDTADYIEELEAELDAANNKLAKALEIAELFSGGVEYDYHGNIIGEEERKAMAELEELTGGKDE